LIDLLHSLVLFHRSSRIFSLVFNCLFKCPLLTTLSCLKLPLFKTLFIILQYQPHITIHPFLPAPFPAKSSSRKQRILLMTVSNTCPVATTSPLLTHGTEPLRLYITGAPGAGPGSARAPRTRLSTANSMNIWQERIVLPHMPFIWGWMCLCYLVSNSRSELIMSSLFRSSFLHQPSPPSHVPVWFYRGRTTFSTPMSGTSMHPLVGSIFPGRLIMFMVLHRQFGFALSDVIRLRLQTAKRALHVFVS
jgi:hypothetical protein